MVQKLNQRSKKGRLAAKRDRKRLDILRSAAAAFRDRGFEAASMAQIADGVDMTKGNLYYYFKNKQEILYFTQDASLDRLLHIASATARLDRSCAVKLNLVIQAHVRCLLEELAAGAAHLEFHALPPAQLRRVLAKRDRYEERLRALVAEGVRRKEFDCPNVKQAILFLLGSVNWAARWYRPEGEWTASDIAREMARYLVRGLLAEGSGAEDPDPALLAKVLK